MKDNIEIVRLPPKMAAKLDRYIYEYHLQKYEKELNYHFNRKKWPVNLADTKKSMINYDFKDLVSTIYIKVPKNDGETNRDHKEREMEITETLRSNLLNLYNEFREYVIETLKPAVINMEYDDLFDLFDYTWGEAPFNLKYLLEDMFLLLGDKSMMQNVVGNSGAFKSTRTHIEANSLPSVLFIDDATVPGISRDCQTKGNDYLNDTVVYYNDVGDSSQMVNNFKDCLQTVYKKLFSEGRVNRTIAQKNSDKTLHLDLVTENGFKLKFNSVKPIFNEDDGQTAARTRVINLPAFTQKDASNLILSGRFGNDVWARQDPRIFKDVLITYYMTREQPNFDKEYRDLIQIRVTQDNNGEVNWHLIGSAIYVHEEMHKLYGPKLYKKYFNRVMINNSIADVTAELYDIIKDGLQIQPREYVESIPNLNEYVIAKTKSASAHKTEREYEAFTIKAVKGIRKKFIKNHMAQIPTLLKTMEEQESIMKIGTLPPYNVYVLLKKDDSNV